MRLSQHVDKASNTTRFKMKTLEDARPVADISLSTDDVPYLPAMATPNDPGLRFDFNRTDNAEDQQTTIVVNISPGQMVEARPVATVMIATADVSLLPSVFAAVKAVINGTASLQRMALEQQREIDAQSDLAKALINRAINPADDDQK